MSRHDLYSRHDPYIRHAFALSRKDKRRRARLRTHRQPNVGMRLSVDGATITGVRWTG